MKNELQIREALIENTIHLIAEGGFEKATTRNIAQYGNHDLGVTLNDAHIYRIFGSKEALYGEAFARLNDELFAFMCRGFDKVDFVNKPIKGELHRLFVNLWNFVLAKEPRTRAFTRYYYSIYLKEASLRRHREAFDVVAGRMKAIFKEEADVNAIMHNILTSILGFAVRVFNGDILNSESNTEHIFNVLYSSLVPYLKES